MLNSLDQGEFKEKVQTFPEATIFFPAGTKFGTDDLQTDPDRSYQMDLGYQKHQSITDNQRVISQQDIKLS